MRNKLLLGGIFAALLGAVAWAQSPGVNSPFQPVWSIPLDSIKRTYVQTVTQLSASSAAATDVVQFCGSATVTTKLTRLSFAGRATTAAPVDVVLVKRSTVDASGTVSLQYPFIGVSVVGLPYDASDSASTANVTAYTTSPSQLGTLVGNIASVQAFLGNLTTGQPGPVTVFDFGNRPSKAPTLRSATQCIAINLSSAVVTGGLYDITVEWTEE